jgi:carbon-monoxide dehydrogenase small subunit
VLIDGKPILACLTLAALAEGREITTIEGLLPAHRAAGGAGADPVQEAFDRCGALQCGFCQPGMILSARALLNATPRPSRDAIRDALSGNLCRCTGYTQIVQAVELAIAEAAGAEPERPDWSPDANPWAVSAHAGRAPATVSDERQDGGRG